MNMDSLSCIVRTLLADHQSTTDFLVSASNRLDRLTSGVMICALTVDASKKLGEWFGGRRNAEGGVSKEYVARVRGEFPVCVALLLGAEKKLTMRAQGGNRL